MNKSLITFSLLVLVVGVMVGLFQYQQGHQLLSKQQQVINNNERINNQIKALNQFKDEEMPYQVTVLWDLNRRINAFIHLYDQKISFKTSDAVSRSVLQGTSAQLTELAFTIGFYDLRDSDDVIRVLKTLEIWQKDFPIKIEEIGGFNRYIQIQGVIVAKKETTS